MADPKQSLVQAGGYNQILSVYDIVRKPQIYAELVKRFGNGFLITNWLHMAGRTINVKGKSLTVFEEGAPERLVKIAISAQTTAGSAVTIVPDASDGSANVLRESFDLIIPVSATNADLPKPARLYKDGTAWKMFFYDNTVTVPSASTVEVMIGSSSHAFGSEGVDSMADGYFQKTFHMSTLKDAVKVEGGEQFQEDWAPVELSNGSVLYQAMVKADFRLDSQLDSALFLGERNTNDNMVQDTKLSGSVKVPGADGLIPTMMENAIPLTWSSSFDIAKFQACKTLFEGVGVVNQNVEFMVGPGLCNAIHDSMQDYLNANSAGHSLYSGAQGGYNALKSVGFGVDVVSTYGLNYNMFECHGLANPNKFGADSYGYRDMGFMFPDGEYNVRREGGIGEPGETIKLSHMTLGYANNKGENRGNRVWKNYRGMASQGGGPIGQTWDVDEYHTLVSYMPIFTQMEKCIFVAK